MNLKKTIIDSPAPQNAKYRKFNFGRELLNKQW